MNPPKRLTAVAPHTSRPFAQTGQAAARTHAPHARQAARPFAPAAYRPQPTPAVLQRRTPPGQSQHQSASNARTPAPTQAHSPHAARTVLQAKPTVAHVVNVQRPQSAAPQVYRPNPTQRVLQPKRAAAAGPFTVGPTTHTSAPPVYRPEPKRVMQLKESAAAPHARQAHAPSSAAAPHVIVPARALNTRAASPPQSRTLTPSQITGARSPSARGHLTPPGAQPRRTVLQAKLAGRGFGVIQRMKRKASDDDFIDDSDDGLGIDWYSKKDKKYKKKKVTAPGSYMDPSDYFDLGHGSDHSDMDGVVWVKRVRSLTGQWRPALWWVSPNEQENDFVLQGTRALDVAALGGDDPGFTWHHCADYDPTHGTCTMQQVPTHEHSSWGHIGGAALSGMPGYAGSAD